MPRAAPQLPYSLKFLEFLVDPAAAVVAAPNLAGQQAAGDRSPGNDHAPQMPDLGPCRFWAQAQYSKSLPAFSEHVGFRKTRAGKRNRMRDGLVIPVAGWKVSGAHTIARADPAAIEVAG